MPRNGKFADDGLVTDLAHFLRNKVYNVDGVNLVPNSSFETPLAGYSSGQLLGWTGVSNPSGRVGTDPRAARSGVQGLVIRPGSGSAAAYGSEFIPTAPGRVYEMSVWCKLISGTDAAQTAGIIVNAYNSGGGLVGSSYPADKPFAGGVGNWVQFKRIYTAPANTASLRFSVWANGSADNLVGFDDVFIEDITNTKRAKQELGVTTISDFGADPTGVSSSESAFRNAIAATPAGGTLRVPKGHYKRPYTSPTGEGSYIVIDKPINIVGEPGTVMEDFLLYFKGAFDSPLGLGADAAEGDRMISTSVPHGWRVGDYVQVMSQYNVYSTAAGAYQLGSVNPTHGTTPTVRTGEIHRVGHVPNTVGLNLDGTLVFGGYKTSGAEVRRIRTLDGVTVQGIRFVNTENANYLGIVARGCSNLVIRDCDFVSGSNAGKSVQIYDSIGTRIIGGSVIKYTDAFSGSSWNTIIIGGGCTDTIIEGVYAEGGAQTIDFTNHLGTSSALAGASGPDGRTVQGMVVRGCTFRNCGDAFTTHPGTMGFFAHGNDIQGGSTGIRVRSRRSVVTNNTIRTARAGIALSGFVHDSLIANNNLIHLPSAAFPGYYYGVGYHAISSETDNRNRLVYPQIKGNMIEVKNGVNALSRAIILTYANISGYTISDAWKKDSSFICVEGNTLRGGGIQVSDAINACRILNNTFQGGNDNTHRIVCLSTANLITGNNFVDNGPHIKQGPVPFSGEYGYNTVNRVGGNNYQFPPINELANTVTTFTEE